MIYKTAQKMNNVEDERKRGKPFVFLATDGCVAGNYHYPHGLIHPHEIIRTELSARTPVARIVALKCEQQVNDRTHQNQTTNESDTKRCPEIDMKICHKDNHQNQR